VKDLELLAPARNADIGIAAIDCGADAVYIAGPGFGARQAAGNSVEDIERLCSHAHRFGARVFVTVNTIIFDNELDQVRKLVRDVVKAGADALIVQDLAMLSLAGDCGIPLHASTQCAIRTPEKARFLAEKGYSRLILERELSLAQIKAIGDAAPECEIEFFVHGALCVCYSGQCYLSENIAGRSANRGACIQACRSRYDLVDENGKVLVKDKALLSLKDYRLLDRLGDLAEAGVCSFKIEGRLKNESYVRNVVREYSIALDALVAANPTLYRRASFGRVAKSFTPALDKTFNRGYTELYIDGTKPSGKGVWASMDAAKGMGEAIGKVFSVKTDLRRSNVVIEVETPAGCQLHNGDGFSFVAGNGDAIGFRGDVCENIRSGLARIISRKIDYIYKGAFLYRNLDAEFEKEIARNPGTREIGVELDVIVGYHELCVTALSEDGRRINRKYLTASDEEATNIERLEGLFISQLGKTAGIYRFNISSILFTAHPLVSSAFLNGIRRDLAEVLDKMHCIARPLLKREVSNDSTAEIPQDVLSDGIITYKANVANRIAREIYLQSSPESVTQAYEIDHQNGAELMRTRYCIRKELGMCLLEDNPKARRLYLLNNGRRLALSFDCRNCEMVVKEG